MQIYNTAQVICTPDCGIVLDYNICFKNIVLCLKMFLGAIFLDFVLFTSFQKIFDESEKSFITSTQSSGGEWRWVLTSAHKALEVSGGECWRVHTKLWRWVEVSAYECTQSSGGEWRWVLTSFIDVVISRIIDICIFINSIIWRLDIYVTTMNIMLWDINNGENSSIF